MEEIDIDEINEILAKLEDIIPQSTAISIREAIYSNNSPIITEINGKAAVSNEMFSKILFNSEGEVTITLSRNGKERDVTLLPADTHNGPRLGLWLRDSTAGLGTITCYTDTEFAALGHGICDIDTGCIMPVGKGVIQDCTSTVIKKGKNGAPGAITGDISGTVLGEVTKNTEHGLF